MSKRTPPPLPRRRSTTEPRVQTDLARVRRIAGQLDERPFDPSQRGSWRGSSRDLVVNPREYNVRMVHKIAPRDTDRATVSMPESAFSDTKSMGAALRKAGLLVSGQRVREMRAEGNRVIVFPEASTWHSFIIDMGDGYSSNRHRGRAMSRNGDVPKHLREAEINELPEHNGQDIGYSQGYRSKREPGWYQVEYATGSDYSGGSVHESNYRVLRERLEELYPEDASPVVWARTSGGHGTYGIVVRYNDLDEEIREALEGLEDYPLLDEQDHSNLEIEQQDEAWDNWAKDDFIKECAKDLEIDPDELTERAEEAGIEWYTIFRAAVEKANVYWEDQQGAGQWIDLDRVADAATDFIAGAKFPSWVDADTVEEYEKLGTIAQSLQEESEE